MTSKTVTVYNGPITVPAIWLACTESRSVRAIWLAGTEVGQFERSDWLVRKVGPYRTIWLACTESRSVRAIWLAGTDVGPCRTLWLTGMDVRPYRKLWLPGTEVGPYRTLWLDGFASRSWTEQSNWRFRRSVFGCLWWTSCFAILDSSSRTTRKWYVKCVLFCGEIAVQPAVVRKTNKRTSLLYITYSTCGGVTLLCTMLNDGAQ